MHIELLTVTATAAATTGTAGTAIAGDSLTAKNGKGAIEIMAWWQTNQSAGFSQVSFPSAHDSTRGYRSGAAIGVNPSLMPFGTKIAVNAQETLAVLIGATAVAGDVENCSFLVRYKDMPGITQRLMTPSSVESRTEKLTSIEQSQASTAGPSYGTETLITVDSNLLLANRDYAVLGATCRTAVHSINMRGPDLGNVRIGVPGMLRQEVGSQWFLLQSRLHGEALVPIISSGNKASTFLGVTTDENAGTFVVTWHLALLK